MQLGACKVRQRGATDLRMRSEKESSLAAPAGPLNTGCRLRETRIPLSCIDVYESKITFQSPKGGEVRAFSVPMPTALETLFKRLSAEGRQCTLEFPFQPLRRWQQFFIKLGRCIFAFTACG